MKALSPKQREVLEAILRSLRQRGMPPILEEIAEAIGVTSRFGPFATSGRSSKRATSAACQVPGGSRS